MDSKKNIRKKSFVFYHLQVLSKSLYTLIACLFLAFVVPSCKKEDKGSKPTGTTTIRPLIPSPGSTLSGTATIEENEDKSFNIKLDLLNTTTDTIWLDVHNGSFADPFGKQAIDLGTVVGTGGSASKTISNLKRASLPDMTRIDVPYDSILTFNGFINISSVAKPHNTSTALAHVMLGQ